MHSSLQYSPTLRFHALEVFVDQHVREQMQRQRDVPRKIEHLVKYLSQSYFLTRPHSNPVQSAIWMGGGMMRLNTASSFTERRLRRHLGGTRGDYKKYLRPLWHFPDGDDGYYPGHYTKPYVLKAAVEKLVNECWRDGQANIQWEPGATTFPENGVLRTSFFEFPLPSIISFETSRINEEIARLEHEEEVRRSRVPLQVLKGLRWLYKVRQWQTVAGGIPNLYHDYKPSSEAHTGKGRLMGLGECSLQRMERGVRASLYRGTGWWNYDFNACHPTIFCRLAQHFGIPNYTTADYLENLAARQTELADRWGISTAKVKTVITSAFLGQRHSIHRKHSSLRKLVGPDAGQRILDDPYYQLIRMEILLARQVIIRHHRIKEKRKFTSVRNAAGKIHPLRKTDGKKYPPNTILSFILLGYEAWALNTSCRLRTDVLVPMHDGWVSENEFDIPSTETFLSLESVQEFGFDIGLRLKGRQM